MAGGAGLKEAAEFADLGDFDGLAAGAFEQVPDFLVGGGQLVLRGYAPGDFLLLVELGEGQAESEGEKRHGDCHIDDKFSVRLFPTIRQPNVAGEQGNQNQVGAEEAEEICRLWAE